MRIFENIGQRVIYKLEYRSYLAQDCQLCLAAALWGYEDSSYLALSGDREYDTQMLVRPA